VVSGTGGLGRTISSRGLPRGPPEWGEVLYEPEWVRTRRFESLGLIFAGIVVASLGIIMLCLFALGVAIGNLAPWRWESVHQAISMVFWGIVILLTGASSLWFGVSIVIATELEEMPFRVYEAGFTKRNVPAWQGLRRRESLVGWDRLRSVRVMAKTGGREGLDRHIELVYDEGGEEPVTERLKSDDPHAVLRAVGSHAPGALDASAMPFLAKGAGRLPDVPLMVRRRPSVLGWSFIPVLLLMWFLFVPLLGMMLRDEGWGSEAPAFILGGGAVIISLLLTSFIIIFGRMESGEHYRWAVFARARLVGDAVVLPPRGPARFMLRARDEIPIGEVVEVRRFLDPDTLSQLAMLRTVTGEELEVRPGLLRAFARHPSFEMGDYAAVNMGALEVDGARVIRPKRERAIALTTVPLLLLAYVVIGPEVVMTEEWGNASLIGTVLLGDIIVLFAMAYLRIIVRIHRRGVGMEASAEGITYPSVLGLRRSIPRERISDVSVRYRSLLGHHISVRTGLRRVTFPLDVNDRLVQAGFTVDDPEDVLVGL